MAKQGTELVEISRPGQAGEDDDFYGDPATDFVTVATCEVAIIWPTGATMDGERGITSTDELSVFIPEGTLEWAAGAEQALLERDKITARGKEWARKLGVGDWRKPRTGERVGLIFELTRWSG